MNLPPVFCCPWYLNGHAPEPGGDGMPGPFETLPLRRIKAVQDIVTPHRICWTQKPRQTLERYLKLREKSAIMGTGAATLLLCRSWLKGASCIGTWGVTSTSRPALIHLVLNHITFCRKKQVAIETTQKALLKENSDFGKIPLKTRFCQLKENFRNP